MQKIMSIVWSLLCVFGGSACMNPSGTIDERRLRETIVVRGQFDYLTVMRHLSDVLPVIMKNADYQSNLHLIETCKDFYSRYHDNKHLFSGAVLNPQHYIKAMVLCARNNDKEKIKYLIHHESEENKKERKSVLEFFEVKDAITIEDIIAVYGVPQYSNFFSDCYMVTSIIYRSIPVLRLFLAQGLAPDVKCSNCINNSVAWRGCVPLLYQAIKNKKSAVIELLLADSRTDPNYRGRGGSILIDNTLLHTAACHDDVDLIKMLFKHPQCDPNIENNMGNTPLLIAIQRSHNKVIHCLLGDSRTDPNMRGSYVNSFLTQFPRHDKRPLFVAAVRNNAKALKYLLNNPRTNPYITDENGYTALDIARMYGNSESVKVLSNHPCISLFNNKEKKEPLEKVGAHKAASGNRELLSADKGNGCVVL